MAKITLFFLYTFLLAFLITNEGAGCEHDQVRRKLFVFGDSYADTGNLGKVGLNISRSWYEPYGITFPHHPTGRFSDGRLSTDFLARFMGIKSPIPYKDRRATNCYPFGMNFAIGGSGVFDTGKGQRTLSAQIDTFQAEINRGAFSKEDVESSIVYVAISGNDYSHYADLHGLYSAIADCTNVTLGLAAGLEKLSKIGVKTIVLTNLGPLDCTPSVTRSMNNYTDCDWSTSPGSMQHNLVLLQGLCNTI